MYSKKKTGKRIENFTNVFYRCQEKFHNWYKSLFSETRGCLLKTRVSYPKWCELSIGNRCICKDSVQQALRYFLYYFVWKEKYLFKKIFSKLFAVGPRFPPHKPTHPWDQGVWSSFWISSNNQYMYRFKYFKCHKSPGVFGKDIPCLHYCLVSSLVKSEVQHSIWKLEKRFRCMCCSNGNVMKGK